MPVGRQPRASKYRMKVLFITRKWPPAVGGMEVYSRELVRELRDRVELDLRVLPGQANGSPPSGWALVNFALKTAGRLIASRAQWDVVHGGDLAIWPLVWLATLRRRNRRCVI